MEPDSKDKSDWVFSKIFFYICSCILFFWLGLFVCYFSLFWFGKYTNKFKKSMQFTCELPYKILNGYYINRLIKRANNIPQDLLLDDFYPGKAGITKSTERVQPGYLLISRLDKEQNQFIIELMEKTSGRIIHKWIPSYEDIYKYKDLPISSDDAQSSLNMEFSHPLLLKDGSIIFIANKGRLIRMSKDSRIIWQIKHAFHHSINMDHEGNIWIPSEISNSSIVLHPIKSPLYRFYSQKKVLMEEQSLVKVNQDGEILEEISLPELLVNNGLKATFISKWTERLSHDPTHLNDIEPVLKDTNFAKQGDLFLSMRSINLVLLYRPSTKKVIWYKVGPWIAQHDVTIDNMDEITVLSNDRPLDPYDDHMRSKIITYNFKLDRFFERYKKSADLAEFYVWSGGQQTILPNGNVLLGEDITGRILELSKDDIEWEYVNRYDDKSLGSIWWLRFLQLDEVNEEIFQDKK